MDENRRSRVWAAIDARARAEGVSPSVRHACLACAEAINATGASLTLTLGSGGREPVVATDPRSEELEELQYTLGQGPCADVTVHNRPVLVDDLATPASRRRWPVFAPEAAARGVHGMFALPISAGAARLGVLSLYRSVAGPLGRRELDDVLAYADAVLTLALDRRGGIPPDLNHLGDAGVSHRRAEVHQAAGMISVQLGISIGDALARLRAHAYLHDQRLSEVAAAVVARRLRFRPGQNGEGPGDAGESDDNGGPGAEPSTGNGKERDMEAGG